MFMCGSYNRPSCGLRQLAHAGVVAVNLAVCLAGEVFAQVKPAKAQGEDQHIQQFLNRHCVGCHRGDKPKGDLRLDNLSQNLIDQSIRKQWQKVMQRVEAGEMPPKSRPRPSEKEIQAITGWFAPRLAAAAAAARAAQGRSERSADLARIPVPPRAAG